MVVNTSTDSLFPLFETYGDPVALPPSALLPGEGAEFSLSGWKGDRAYRTTLTVQFGDLSHPLLQGTYIRHGEDLDRKRRDAIPVVANEQLPITALFASRGQERLEIEIARVDSGLSRVWAESLAVIGSLGSSFRRVSATRSPGSLRAFALGMGGTIEFADRLVRITHDNGVAPLTSESTQSARELRAAQVTAETAQILEELVI